MRTAIEKPRLIPGTPQEYQYLDAILECLPHSEEGGLRSTNERWWIRTEIILHHRFFGDLIAGGVRNIESPETVRSTIQVHERELQIREPNSKEYQNSLQILEWLRERLDRMVELAEHQPDLRGEFPGPWNVASTLQGKLMLIQGDSEALATRLQIGGPVKVRILGQNVEDRPAAVPLLASAPVDRDSVYPRLEWGLEHGRVLKLEPPPPRLTKPRGRH